MIVNNNKKFLNKNKLLKNVKKLLIKRVGVFALILFLQKKNFILII